MKTQSQRLNILIEMCITVKRGTAGDDGKLAVRVCETNGRECGAMSLNEHGGQFRWSSFAVLAFFLCVCVCVSVCVCVIWYQNWGTISSNTKWVDEEKQRTFKIVVKFGAQLGKITELAPPCGMDFWFYFSVKTEKWTSTTGKCFRFHVQWKLRRGRLRTPANGHFSVQFKRWRIKA